MKYLYKQEELSCLLNKTISSEDSLHLQCSVSRIIVENKYVPHHKTPTLQYSN